MLHNEDQQAISKRNAFLKNSLNLALPAIIIGYLMTLIQMSTLIPVLPSGEYKVFDFVVFYDAARLAVKNIGQMYDVNAQIRMFQQVSSTQLSFITPFVSPPQSLLFFMPLTVFSLVNAYRIWMVVNLLVTFMLCRIFSQGTTGHPVSIPIALLLFGTSFPWLGTLLIGQPMLVMTLAFMLSYFLARQQQFFAAALLLCLTAFKPQLSAAPALYLCLLYGIPMVRAFVLAACLTVAVCGLWFGWQIWPQYWHVGITMVDTLPIYDVGMSNIRALGAWLLPVSQSMLGAITSLLCILGFLGIFLAGLRAKQASQEIQDLGFALILPVSALFSPYLMYHSIILQAISVYFLYRYCGRRVVYALLALNVITIIVPALLSQSDHVLNARLLIVAQAALIVWCARAFLRCPQTSLS